MNKELGLGNLVIINEITKRSEKTNRNITADNNITAKTLASLSVSSAPDAFFLLKRKNQ
jgi:hypothetical protein